GRFPTGGFGGFGVAAGDFNRDGRPDLVTADTFSDSVSVLLNTTGAAAVQTATTLSTSDEAASFGQPGTLRATVTSAAGVPTGTVTFLVGNTVVARVTLDANGQARLRGFFSVRGLFTIRAVYSGDANFAASSQSLTEQVI